MHIHIQGDLEEETRVQTLKQQGRSSLIDQYVHHMHAGVSEADKERLIAEYVELMHAEVPEKGIHIYLYM